MGSDEDKSQITPVHAASLSAQGAGSQAAGHPSEQDDTSPRGSAARSEPSMKLRQKSVNDFHTLSEVGSYEKFSENPYKGYNLKSERNKLNRSDLYLDHEPA